VSILTKSYDPKSLPPTPPLLSTLYVLCVFFFILSPTYTLNCKMYEKRPRWELKEKLPAAPPIRRTLIIITAFFYFILFFIYYAPAFDVGCTMHTHM
jgi:hypothetical protein